MALDADLRRKLTRTANSIARNTTERDRLIAIAYQAGATMREIARAARMTHPSVRSILIRDGIHDFTRDT